MKIDACSPEEYGANAPEEKRAAFSRLRAVVLENLPEGFQETMSYGMIGYVVPHSLYGPGYHCDPKLPLPFMAIACQKNFIAFYHMGIYADPDLLEWFKSEYARQVPSRLDMGKSCIRLKKADRIPYKLIGELVRKVTVKEWIVVYESTVKGSRKR